MLPGVSPKAVGISRKETTPMSNSRVSTGVESGTIGDDYLCPALRGHIQYFATSYSKSADPEGRAAIRVDAWKCCGATTTPILKMCGRISSLALHHAERSRLRKRGHQSGSCLCAGAGHL